MTSETSSWLSHKPSDWELKKVRELFSFSKGSGLPKENIIKNGSNECIHYGEIYTKYKYDVTISDNISKTNQTTNLISGEKQLVSPSSTTTVGSDLSNCKNLNKKNVYVGGDVIVYTPRINEIDLDYYSLFITYVCRPQFHIYSKCTTVCHIYETQIRDFDVLSPPLQNQEKISRFLKEKLKKFQILIDESKSKRDKLQKLVTTIIDSEIFKNYLLPNSSVGNKFIDDISNQKNVTKLKYLTSKINGGLTPKGGGNIYRDEGIKFIREQNIYDGILLLDGIVHIPHEVHEKMKNSKVKKGDVLLNMTGGSVGRCCSIEDDGEYNINQHISIIRPLENLNSKFLEYYLRSTWGKNQTYYYMESSGKEGLSSKKIKNYLIPVIDINEQLTIVENINTKLKKTELLIEKEEKKINLIESLINDYMVNYLTGRKMVN
tara:strand:- start:4263 stop:5561 length:1299 start_codon:yes stop_codon:yes gene_type:complete